MCFVISLLSCGSTEPKPLYNDRGAQETYREARTLLSAPLAGALSDFRSKFPLWDYRQVYYVSFDPVADKTRLTISRSLNPVMLRTSDLSYEQLEHKGGRYLQSIGPVIIADANTAEGQKFYDADLLSNAVLTGYGESLEPGSEIANWVSEVYDVDKEWISFIKREYWNWDRKENRFVVSTW